MATTEVETDTKNMDEIRTLEHKLRMKIGRTIGRGVWEAGHKVEFPDATKDERHAAWELARKDFTKIGLRALKTLEKTGFDVVEKDG